MLNAAAIAKLINKSSLPVADRLLISPALNLDRYDESGEASIDLRLGCWFLTNKLSKMHLLDVANPSTDFASHKGIEKHYIPFGSQFILHPRSFVLAATLEWIKLPNSISGLVSGKSSWGRRGLVIETAPGVHPGFGGCLTLELANVGEVPIAIYPGLNIAQLFLFKVDSHHFASSHSEFSGRRQPVYSSITPDGPANKLMGRS